ncbi:MAG: thermonuclease family protein [Rhodospirillales bacterium]|nr:thermonuclease family protein [Rhodospirillales bacterium]
MFRRVFVLAATAVALHAAAPTLAREGFVEGGAAEAREAVDGDTVILADGRHVRLVGIQAPKLALGRANFKDWPLAEDSKRAVEALVLGKRVTLRSGGTRQDRHGRALAHLYRDDGLWIQGEMLKLGMARVYTFPDNRALAAEMYVLEAEARTAHRGIWAHPFYAVRAPEGLKGDIGTFQVVAGTVVEAAAVKNTVFLNFGADWRTDFTVRLDGAAIKLFRAAKADPLAFKGRTIEIRGWLRFKDGPMIDASHPEQFTPRP